MLIWLGVGRFVTTFLQCRGEWSRQGHKLKTTTEPYESKEEKKRIFIYQHVFSTTNRTSFVFFFSRSLYLLIEMRGGKEWRFSFYSCISSLFFLISGPSWWNRWSVTEFLWNDDSCRFSRILSSPYFSLLYLTLLTRQIPYHFDIPGLLSPSVFFFAYAWLRSSFVIENCMFCSGYSPKASINIPVTTECALSCPV